MSMAALILVVGMAGYAATHLANDERAPTTSDMSDVEIIEAANTVREQLELSARVRVAEMPSVDRATAVARAEARAQTMQDRYWHALEGRHPGIDPDLLTLIERVPPPRGGFPTARIAQRRV